MEDTDWIPPPEKALRVLKSPEGLHGTCHQLRRYNAGGGRKQTRCLPPLIERAPIGHGGGAAARFNPVYITFVGPRKLCGALLCFYLMSKRGENERMYCM